VRGMQSKDGRSKTVQSARRSKTTETVYLRFIEGGGTYEDIMPAITLNKTKLKDAVKTATGAKGKELDAKLSALLDGCTESKAGQPTLTKIK